MLEGMIEEDLPFSRFTAFRLMTVAKCSFLANVAHVQHLPPHWGTLYELTNEGAKATHASLLKLKGIYRAGRILTEMAERGERKQMLGDQTFTLEDLNISRYQSHIWQTIAQLTEGEIEEYKTKVLGGEDPFNWRKKSLRRPKAYFRKPSGEGGKDPLERR